MNGLRGAIDFVRTQLHVEKLDNLPYSTLLVPLSVYFAANAGTSVKTSDEQRRQILRWFWRSCFSARYGRVVQRNLAVDIIEMARLREGNESKLGDFASGVSAEFFTENRFNLNTVSSKTHILLLTQAQPLSLVSGAKVDLSLVLKAYNRNEFHHIYPQKFLRDIGITSEDQSPLANICFINAIDNKTLGGDAPSKYISRLASEDRDIVLARAYIPSEELIADAFQPFLIERAKLLAAVADGLMSD